MSRFAEWRERRRARDIERVQAAQALIASMSPWARKGVYFAGGVLFAAGIGMSGFFLSQLAESFGIDAPFSFLLPAALDAGAIVGVFMWVTGTGEIDLFGRTLARQLFALSILGNGLERALTFAPNGQPPANGDAFLVLLERTVALMTLLTTWADPRRTAATWFLLLVSIGIGIVFPALAYKMGHAIILARKSADTPTRGARKSTDAPTRTGRKATLGDRIRDTVGRPADEPTPAVTTATSAPAAPPERPAATPPVVSAPPVTPEPVAAVAAPPVPLPYVHDSRDLEPGTAEWQARYDRLPGRGKQAKLEHWLELEWANGREPKLTPDADRVVGGNRVAQLAKRALIARGVVPPAQRVDEQNEREPVRDVEPASREEVRDPSHLARVS